MLKTWLPLIAITVFTVPTWAHQAGGAADLLLSSEKADSASTTGKPDICAAILSGSQEQVYHQFFKSYADNWNDGLGMRGFHGAAIPNTPYTALIATQYGLTWWGLKFQFAATLEEAVAHRLKFRQLHEVQESTFSDATLAPLYFIGSEDELKDLKFGDGKVSQNQTMVPPEKVAELIQRGAYQIDHLGKTTFITPEHLARRLSLNGMTYNKVADLPGNFGKNSLAQSGWVTLKEHGIHDYSTWKETGAAKSLLKLARKLAAQGYTIRFNTDYQAILDGIKNQDRSYREYESGDDGQLVKGERKTMGSERSRYQDETLYNAALENLQAGKGYSVGLYDPSGKLVAGEIGTRDGNHLYGDSLFYDKVEHAKICALALFEVLYAAGMPYSDPGMISKYSGSMGAENLPFPEYLAKIKSGPKEPIVLPDVWDPRPANYFEGELSEIAKRRNMGLGNMLVTRRMPVDTEATRAYAATLGLERARLNIVLVTSPEQASSHAATVEWADAPIYLQVEADELLKLDESAVTTLKRLTQLPTTEAYFIANKNYPDHRKKVLMKQLTDALELNIEVAAPAWQNPAAELPTITVEGWGFTPKR